MSSGSQLVSPDKEEVAHMLFAPGMSRLFSTHPPIAERIHELDPSFKRQDLPALAAAAGRDAEALRLAPAFAEIAASDVQPSHLAPEAVATSAAASHVAGLTGTFDENQQRYAREARESIPEELHAFADSPDAARVLLFALLRGGDAGVAARQDAVIQRAFGDAMLARIHASLPVAEPPEPGAAAAGRAAAVPRDPTHD